MRVVDPDGVEWDVGRRWLELPRWRFRVLPDAVLRGGDGTGNVRVLRGRR